MTEIPKPEVLDADRVDRDDREDLSPEDRRSQAQLLAKALAASCDYADALWEQLDVLRGYLLESLPPDPHRAGPHRTAGAAPTGPDDEQGWQRWITAYATTTSTLCGPQGDSGYGLSRARQEAQQRRTSPELLLHHRRPDLGAPGGAGDEPPAAPGGAAAQRSGAGRSGAQRSALVAGVALGFALRGLLGRRRGLPGRGPGH